MTAIKELIEQATIVVVDGTSYRVHYCEADCFIAEDEENGDTVSIYYEEIDLKRDSIFKLTLLNP